MNTTYAEARSNSLFVQGVAQYTAVGAGFFSIKDLNVSKLARGVIDAVRFQARRRSIEAQLNAMSDHMLADIGVVRGDIPSFAREWAKCEHPAGASKILFRWQPGSVVTSNSGHSVSQSRLSSVA